MEKSITITVNEDLRALLEVYDISLQDLVQKFTDKISYPVYYNTENSNDLWATEFFFYYVEAYIPISHEDFLFDHPFLQGLVEAVRSEINSGRNFNAIEAGRKAQRKWVEAKKAMIFKFT